MTRFYAEYSPSTTSLSGCVHRIMRGPVSSLGELEASIERRCKLCNTTHHFILDVTRLASTPSQKANLIQWAQGNGIELEQLEG